MELGPLDRWKFAFMAFYASTVTFLSFAYFFAVSFRAIPEDSMGNVNIILGFLLGTAVSSFIGYFFGSSQSATAHTKIPPSGVTIKGEVECKEDEEKK